MKTFAEVSKLQGPLSPVLRMLVLILVLAAQAASAQQREAGTAGVRVTGRVAGLPANMPLGYVRVMLLPEGPTRGAGRMLDTMAQQDGTFEFSKVPPGAWSIRTDGSVALPRPSFLRFEVNDSDVGPIELQAGALIVGQVTVEDGTPLPVVTNPGFWSLWSVSNPNLPSLVRLFRIATIQPAANTPVPGAGPLAVVRGDGFFVVLNLPPGEYRIGAQVPFGHAIRSMTFNDTDILQTTMKVADARSANGNLRVVLTRASSSTGVKVSGRVAGPPPPAPSWIAMQPATLVEGGTGEAMVRPDGTFEFIGVTPGVYAAQMWTMPMAAWPVPVEIVVGDRDLSNVEIPNVSATPAK